MRIISKNQVPSEMLEQVKLPMVELSKRLRNDLMHQMAEGLSKKLPVKVNLRKDVFHEVRELETEFYLFTREQMESIVGFARELTDGNLSVKNKAIVNNMMEVLSSDIPDLKEDEINMFPDIADKEVEVKEPLGKDVN